MHHPPGFGGGSMVQRPKCVNPDRTDVREPRPLETCSVRMIAGITGAEEEWFMRIIAGERRGHKFDGPDDSVTRPTSDMVREAIFNILGDRVEDLVVYDLFAGTGALGFEALSRGASHCIFVEKDRRNLALIRRNIATLKYEGRCSIIGADAYRWAATFEPEGTEPTLLMLDPPYRDFEHKVVRVSQMIANLMERLPTGSILLVESDRDYEEEFLPDRDAWDVRSYGRTEIAIRVMGVLAEDAEPTDESVEL